MQQKIPLSMAHSGMFLAEPVYRANGTLVVGKGCELTETLLSRLNAMGIDSIVVCSTQIDQQAPESSWSDRAARLDYLFRKHVDDAWMEEIKGHIAEYFLLRGSMDAAKTSESIEAAGEGV